MAKVSKHLANANVKPLMDDFLGFMNAAVTPFHACEIMAQRLAAKGYAPLREQDEWPELKPGDKYYVTRNDSSIVAFAVGAQFKPGNGLKIIGAHTDSPNLMLKPKTHASRANYVGVGTQCYGGGLWHTWFDRDLTVAGRVVLKREGVARIETRLVNLQKLILRVPNLAIHLTTGKERESGFGPNKETHVAPIAASEAFAKEAEEQFNDKDAMPDGQSPILYRLIAEQCGVKVSEIIDFDLSLVDTQPATVGGAYDEFVFSPRIDNLLSCYTGLKALIDTDATLATEDMVRMIAFFDNEEVGSASSRGANGTLVPDIVERLHATNPAARSRSVANSFLLSVDGAHGCHPNYADRHEVQHRPLLHQGPVIKYNANQRYATTGTTAATVTALARLADVPIQQICVKNDSPCGSTIGPILSTLTGIASVDLGNAMLSMHSIREMCGTLDVHYLTVLIAAFFDKYQAVRQA